MNREPTWLEAATIILESSDDTWMTAPELVRTIRKSGVRTLRSDYGQAVRTLRTALNYETKKTNGNFSRKDYNYNCYFALRKILESSTPNKQIKSTTKRPSVSKPPKQKRNPSSKTIPPIVNGLPPTLTTPPSPLHTLTHVGLPTPTIEIDPHLKPFQRQRQGSESGGFCLPSPLTSLLGPRRIMNVLSESSIEPTTNRPVREVRKRRRTKDQENDEPLSVVPNGPSSSIPSSQPEILHLEVCHPLPCHCSDVSCVRSVSSNTTAASREDPCSAQGARVSSESIEIEPNYIHKTDDSSSDLTSSETNSEDDDETICLQPTPSTQLLVRRPRRRANIAYYDSSQTEDDSESELSESSGEDSPRSVSPSPRRLSTISEHSFPIRRKRGRPRGSVSSIRSVSSSVGAPHKTDPVSLKSSMDNDVNRLSKPSEQRRHVSTLFLPTSPLLDENLKTILGLKAFEGLNESQKSKLLSHLPFVDQQNGTSVPVDCFTNSFYSSGLREWSERLAIGMYTAEYKARLRGEEKRKMSLKPENNWKAKYYERHYGDRVNDEDSSPPPYYPYSQPSPSNDTLTAIVNRYSERDTKQSTPVEPPSPPRAFTPPPQTPPKTIPTPISPKQPKVASPKKNSIKPVSKKVKNSSRSPIGKPSKSVVSSKKTLQLNLVKTSPVSKQRNHIAKKTIPNALVKKSSALPTLLSVKTNKIATKKHTIKRLGTSSQALVHKLLSKSSSVLKRDILTRLPEKVAYQEILQNLMKASKSNRNVQTTELLKITSYTPPSSDHKHSVFHDHYALLSREHVPIDFCFRVTSLPVSLPLELYTVCLRSRMVTREHSYARTCDSPQSEGKSLTLSLPRSLMRTTDQCVCDGRPLVFCSQCHCLYHSNCTESTLCPTCLVIV